MWTKGAGHINISPDIDGTIRKSPLIIDYKDGEYPQLAFQLVCDYLGAKKEDIISAIPVDAENRMIIKWAGKWKETFKHYSYIDIIASYESLMAGKKPRIDLRDFEGKICLIGLTATGLYDVRPNPIEPAYPVASPAANPDTPPPKIRLLHFLIMEIDSFLPSLSTNNWPYLTKNYV